MTVLELGLNGVDGVRRPLTLSLPPPPPMPAAPGPVEILPRSEGRLEALPVMEEEDVERENEEEVRERVGVWFCAACVLDARESTDGERVGDLRDAAEGVKGDLTVRDGSFDLPLVLFPFTSTPGAASESSCH